MIWIFNEIILKMSWYSQIEYGSVKTEFRQFKIEREEIKIEIGKEIGKEKEW